MGNTTQDASIEEEEVQDSILSSKTRACQHDRVASPFSCRPVIIDQLLCDVTIPRKPHQGYANDIFIIAYN